MSEVTVLPWSELEEEFAGTGSPGSGGALLLGNGFSQNIWSGFGYRRLLDCSELTGVARDLFGDRTNFETVLAELAATERVLGIAAPAQTRPLRRSEGWPQQSGMVSAQPSTTCIPNSATL